VRTARRRLLLWLTLVILGLVAAIVSLIVTRQSPPGHVELSGGGLLVASRDRLAICIKPVAGASVNSARARSAVEDALQELARDPRWSQAAYAKTPPAVDVNCSEEPAIFAPTVTVTTGSAQSSRLHVGRRDVTAPSKYLTIVFVLPDDLMERYFFGLTASEFAKYRNESEELVCEGHVCIEVTRGLYLLSHEIIDPPLVLSALRKVLGYEPL
jgi:hypothetical protein